jgi:integrase
VKLRAPDGRQYARTFRTRKEAEAYQTTERAAHLKLTWIDPEAGAVILGDYAAQWLTLKPTLRPRTFELYEYLLRVHLLPELGELSLKQITSARVRTWYARLLQGGVSRSMAAKAYRLLRSILATAFEDELLARNPCVLRGAGSERAAERPVASVAMVAALADAIDDRYRAMVLLAVWAGLRFGEAAGLERRDVDLDDQTVRIERQLQELKDGSHVVGPPKSDAGHRTIALPPHMVQDLERHLRWFVAADPSSRVFMSPDGSSLRRSNLNRWAWQPACASVAPVGFRFHDLRHTGNTLAASTRASTRELMARMGHSSPRAALIYQHATLERDRTLADALAVLAAGGSGSQERRELRIPMIPYICSGVFVHA